MEIEYSNEIKGKVHAYTFENWEKILIASLLSEHVKKYDKAMEKIRNNPKNEGQATYQSEIDSLFREQKCVEKMIQIFNPIILKK